MLQRFICGLFGHKTVYKAATGQTVVVTNRLFAQNESVLLMRFVRSDYCLRCGKLVHRKD